MNQGVGLHWSLREARCQPEKMASHYLGDCDDDARKLAKAFSTFGM